MDLTFAAVGQAAGIVAFFIALWGVARTFDGQRKHKKLDTYTRNSVQELKSRLGSGSRLLDLEQRVLTLERVRPDEPAVAKLRAQQLVMQEELRTLRGQVRDVEQRVEQRPSGMNSPSSDFTKPDPSIGPGYLPEEPAAGAVTRTQPGTAHDVPEGGSPPKPRRPLEAVALEVGQTVDLAAGFQDELRRSLRGAGWAEATVEPHPDEPATVLVRGPGEAIVYGVPLPEKTYNDLMSLFELPAGKSRNGWAGAPSALARLSPGTLEPIKKGTLT